VRKLRRPGDRVPRPARRATDGPLTGREREIADLVAAGHSRFAW
jgi:DNA-binding CsgD family transcriptional regulator